MKTAPWTLTLLAACAVLALLALLRQTTRTDPPSGPPDRPYESTASPGASDRVETAESQGRLEVPGPSADEPAGTAEPTTAEGPLGLEADPGAVYRSQVEHYRRLLEAYEKLSIGDLRVAQEEAQKAAQARHGEIRDDLIERGQGLVLPFGTEVPEYMIPAPRTERPVQQSTVCTADPTTGEMIETHVFIDPADYPDLVALQNVRGAITVALKRKLAPEAAD